MMTRPKDRAYLRFVGPSDRDHGEFRGQLVELLERATPFSWRVRFPDGSLSLVHDDHLTDAMVRGTKLSGRGESDTRETS